MSKTAKLRLAAHTRIPNEEQRHFQHDCGIPKSISWTVLTKGTTCGGKPNSDDDAINPSGQVLFTLSFFENPSPPRGDSLSLTE